MSRRRLPISVDPWEGETLNSWLLRAADSIRIPPARILEGAGFALGPGAPSYPGFGVDLTAQAKTALAFVANVSAEALSGTLLRVFDGRTVTLAGYDPAMPSTLGNALRSEWVLAAPTPACPTCLVEDGWVWRLEWKTVFVFACAKHDVLLLSTCPGCGKPTGHLRHDRSLMPPFLNSLPSIDQCMNPLKGSGRIGGGQGTPCGQRIEHWPATSLSGWPALAAANRRIVEVLRGSGAPTLAGEEVSVREWFTALKSLIALVLASGVTSETIGLVPDECLDALDDLEDRLAAATIARDRRRARGLDARGGNRGGTMWRTIPSVPLVAAAAPMALQVFEAASPSHALDELIPIWEGVKKAEGRETRVNTFVESHKGIPIALARLYKLAGSSTGRASHRIGIGMESERPDLRRLEARHVPQLLWPERFERDFAHLITESYEQHGRRWTSLALVQHITGWPRNEAVVALGYLNDPDATAKNLSAVFDRVVAAGRAEEFGVALRALALDLDTSDAPLVDYAARRERFSEFELIDEIDFEIICDEAGKAAGFGGRRRNASAWLWAHLTGNDPRDSFALATDGDVEAIREVYRRWVRQDLPDFREALESYADALLAADGFRVANDDASRPSVRRASLPALKSTLASERPDLAADWHPTRNGDLTPDQVAPRSMRKVWWKCSGCGRESEAVVQSRARKVGPGCRYCPRPGTR